MQILPHHVTSLAPSREPLTIAKRRELNTLDRNFVSCTKSKVSTTTLIGVGIAITAGIFGLVFLTVWCMQKSRKTSGAKHIVPPPPPDKLEQDRGGQDVPTILYRPEQPYPNPDHEKRYLSEKPDFREPFGIPQGNAAHYDHYSMTTVHPMVGGYGSPHTDTQPVRPLYPSNPSPEPRHLQASNQTRYSIASHPSQAYPAPDAPPPVPRSAMRAQPAASAMRQSTQTPRSRRSSVASVHFAGNGPVFDPNPPPMPDLASRPALGDTRPLSVRKTNVTSVAIPSYYESTAHRQDTSQSSYDNDLATRRRQSIYNQSFYSSSSSESSVPPLPPYVSPKSAEQMRRPSAASEGTATAGTGMRRPLNGRKGSEGMGGMI